MLLPWVDAILVKWGMPEQAFKVPVCREQYQRAEAVEDAFAFYVHSDLPSREPVQCSVARATGVTK